MFCYRCGMGFLNRLLKYLGLLRVHEPRKYALDVSLQPLLDSMAEHQQRSPDELASDLLNQALFKSQLNADLWRRWLSLSPREQQVTALTCLGETNPQIASRLGLAVETIRTHTRNAQIKFNVNSKADLRVLLSEWDFSAYEQM